MGPSLVVGKRTRRIILYTQVLHNPVNLQNAIPDPLNMPACFTRRVAETRNYEIIERHSLYKRKDRFHLPFFRNHEAPINQLMYRFSIMAYMLH